MRHSSFASTISVIAILWSGIAYGTDANNSDRDWDWCNGTVDGGIPFDAQITGCTVHSVTLDVDGGPIIDQMAVRIEQTDTMESLTAKVQGPRKARTPRARANRQQPANTASK